MAALEAAARAAETAANAAAAADAAWSVLHRDHDVMHPAFVAWNRAHGRSGDIPQLGRVVRRSCASPGQVAASLRAAADGSQWVPETRRLTASAPVPPRRHRGTPRPEGGRL